MMVSNFDEYFYSISKGVVAAFLPIYHYIFLQYSHNFAEEISNNNIELSGKTDLRFVEAMYKVTH
jgi:centrosomal protein CEP44